MSESGDDGSQLLADAATNGSVKTNGTKALVSASKTFDIENLNTVLGFVLAGFAGIASFVGITKEDVPSLLRNEPRPTFLVFFALMVAVLSAMLAVVIDGETGPTVRWGHLYATLSVGTASWFALAALIPADPTTWSSSDKWVAAGVLALVAVVLVVLAQWSPVTFFHGEAFPVDRLFTVVSVILLFLSIYGALRIEAGHTAPSVQVLTTDQGSGPVQDLNMHIVGYRLSETTYAELMVTGSAKPNGSSTGTPKATAASGTASWKVIPDEAGDIDRTIQFPVLPSYTSVKGTVLVCQVAKTGTAKSNCHKDDSFTVSVSS